MTSADDWPPHDWAPDEPPDDQWPPVDRDPTDYSIVGAEPIVGVPAGLLGTAIELLDLCDELVNRPGSSTLDTRVEAVIRRYQQRANVATLRWFHDGLGTTAWCLQELLDDEGIVVEPTLRGRTAPHYR